MIGYIKGEFLYSDKDKIVINCNDLGYELAVKSKEIPDLQKGVKYSFFVQTIFKDQGTIELYGFNTKMEKNLFNQLRSVNKVGPKVALSVLDSISPEELISSIMDKQILILSSVKGIGKKTSERIILELSDKFKKQFQGKNIKPRKDKKSRYIDQIDDLQSILANLGYTTRQIKAVIESFNDSDFERYQFEEIIKISLKRVGGV